MDHLLICITINHGVISMMMDTIRNCSIITLIILVSVRTFAHSVFYHNPLRSESWIGLLSVSALACFTISAGLGIFSRLITPKRHAQSDS